MAINSKIKTNPELAYTSTRKDLDVFLDKVDAEYYNNGTKPIPDSVYDRIMEIYGERFPRSSRLKKVGAKIGSKRAEVTLPNPMSSLTKIKTEDKIALYAEKYPGPYTVSDKIDGMSLQILYINSVPKQLFTRGDGTKGQDISHLIPYLNIPKKIKVTGRFAVRLEGVSSMSAFAKHLSEEAGGKFTATRNAAGGIISKLPSAKDYKEYVKYAKHLSMIAFKIMEGKGSELSASKQFKLLTQLGFQVVPYKVFDDIDFATLSSFLNKRIKSNEYEIDGLVVEQDKPHKITAANPKHAVSFKENSEASMVEVVCTGVTWDVSRTGKIIPQINIKPTRIGGVNVSNFTGHNAFYILHGYLKNSDADKKNAKPKPIGKGAVLKAVRSGQVIPYVVDVLKPAKSASLPEVAYKQVGVHFVALDKGNNETQRLKKLAHFFTTIGVDGFKLNTIQKFWDAGYKTLDAFLNLSVEDFESIPGLGRQKAKEYLTTLRKSLSELTFAKLANASGYFEGFGSGRLESIGDAYPDVMKWSTLSKREIADRIRELNGFKALADDFASALPKLIKFADKYGFKVKVIKQKVVSSKMSNLRVTFTGVRDNELEQAILANGGKVQAMKSDTNILVVKDLGYSSSKVDKAHDTGVPVLTVDMFRKKYKV